MSNFDIIIKNGTIYDGSGNDSFVSDVFIKDGKIIKIGKCSNNDTAKDIIDAENKIVTPGFVDIHTHYDGQATWDNYIIYLHNFCSLSGLISLISAKFLNLKLFLEFFRYLIFLISSLIV